MAHTTRTFRGISRRAARGYLVGLGGEAVDDARVEGDGWTATIEADRVPVGRSLELNEVTITFEGDDIEELVDAFARKAMRAGG